MIEAKHFRIGNLVKYDNRVFPIHTIAEEFPTLDTDEFGIGVVDWNNIEPIPLTEGWLLKFGFSKKPDISYINGNKFLKQVSDDYVDEKEIISRDGTWFDAIGTFNSNETGELVVMTLCRGNYVCNNIKEVHTLQNLYFSLTGKELSYLD